MIGVRASVVSMATVMRRNAVPGQLEYPSTILEFVELWDSRPVSTSAKQLMFDLAFVSLFFIIIIIILFVHKTVS